MIKLDNIFTLTDHSEENLCQIFVFLTFYQTWNSDSTSWGHLCPLMSEAMYPNLTMFQYPNHSVVNNTSYEYDYHLSTRTALLAGKVTYYYNLWRVIYWPHSSCNLEWQNHFLFHCNSDGLFTASSISLILIDTKQNIFIILISYFVFIYYPGLVIISMIGNTLSINTLMEQRVRKKRSTPMFLHLALADCMVTIFAIAGCYIWQVIYDTWKVPSDYARTLILLWQNVMQQN